MPDTIYKSGSVLRKPFRRHVVGYDLKLKAAAAMVGETSGPAVHHASSRSLPRCRSIWQAPARKPARPRCPPVLSMTRSSLPGTSFARFSRTGKKHILVGIGMT